MSESETDARDADDTLRPFEVTIRAWGPEHEPGEAEYDDYLVEASDRDEAEQKAWEEAEDEAFGILSGQRTGETVQVEELPT